ncbi:MAG TPA: aldehyde dehydrogenase family protein [Candidatus Polarisedimenticolia bacterium]|nr:aldehyde dehydrogenase family protein [Candidatus Polarisedimenticolia bacterium]
MPQIAPTKARVEPGRLFINGRFTDAVEGGTFDTINPATGRVLTQVAEGREEDIDRAVKAARAAFDSGPWTRAMTAADRARILWKVGELLAANAQEIGELETLDSGKPVTENVKIDVPFAAEIFQYFAGLAGKLHGETVPVRGPYFSYTLREPVGVCGLITPWNFPLLMAAYKVAPALACGNTAVLKPASYTPMTALRLASLFQEAGLPEGVLNVVPGSGSRAGMALVRHPLVDKIAITGSTPVGQQVMREAASTLKKLSLELGGKSPNIVLADADLDAAVRGAHIGIFYNKGEICTAGSRLFVQQEVHDALMEKLTERAARTRPGDPMDPKCRFGPQASEQQMSTILRYVAQGKEEGARLVTGGRRAEVGDLKGFFVEPTIFDAVRNDMTIAREEIFGPVLSVLTFKDLDEAVALANETIYGLAAGVWTRDIKRAHTLARSLRAGTVWINTYNNFDAAMPFGGYKMSGFGRELGAASLEQYTQLKSVWVDLS